MSGACSTEEGKGAYRVVSGNLERRPLGTLTRSLEIILKRIFKNIIGAWTALICLKIGSRWVAVMNEVFPQNPENFLTS
jgi:hypothetical protein